MQGVTELGAAVWLPWLGSFLIWDHPFSCLHTTRTSSFPQRLPSTAGLWEGRCPGGSHRGSEQPPCSDPSSCCSLPSLEEVTLLHVHRSLQHRRPCCLGVTVFPAEAGSIFVFVLVFNFFPWPCPRSEGRACSRGVSCPKLPSWVPQNGAEPQLVPGGRLLVPREPGSVWSRAPAPLQELLLAP